MPVGVVHTVGRRERRSPCSFRFTRLAIDEDLAGPRVQHDRGARRARRASTSSSPSACSVTNCSGASSVSSRPVPGTGPLQDRPACAVGRLTPYGDSKMLLDAALPGEQLLVLVLEARGPRADRSTVPPRTDSASEPSGSVRTDESSERDAREGVVRERRRGLRRSRSAREHDVAARAPRASAASDGRGHAERAARAPRPRPRVRDLEVVGDDLASSGSTSRGSGRCGRRSRRAARGSCTARSSCCGRELLEVRGAHDLEVDELHDEHRDADEHDAHGSRGAAGAASAPLAAAIPSRARRRVGAARERRGARAGAAPRLIAPGVSEQQGARRSVGGASALRERGTRRDRQDRRRRARVRCTGTPRRVRAAAGDRSS